MTAQGKKFRGNAYLTSTVPSISHLPHSTEEAPEESGGLRACKPECWQRWKLVAMLYKDTQGKAGGGKEKSGVAFTFISCVP